MNKTQIKKIFKEIDTEVVKREVQKNAGFIVREDLTMDEFIILDNFDFNKYELNDKEQIELISIYNRVFNLKQKRSRCAPCWANMLSVLYNLYSAHTKIIN